MKNVGKICLFFSFINNVGSCVHEWIFALSKYMQKAHRVHTQNCGVITRKCGSFTTKMNHIRVMNPEWILSSCDWMKAQTRQQYTLKFMLLCSLFIYVHLIRFLYINQIKNIEIIDFSILILVEFSYYYSIFFIIILCLVFNVMVCNKVK